MKVIREGYIDDAVNTGRILSESADISEVASFTLHGEERLPTARLLTDASGTNKLLGAVLHVEGRWFWTSLKTPEHALNCSVRRRGKQIMGLELLGVACGLSSFEHLLRQRSIALYKQQHQIPQRASQD